MLLNLERARQYTYGDEALLAQLLALFERTLQQLLHALTTFLAGTPDAATATSFYKVVHGAKPAIEIFTDEPMRVDVQQLCRGLLGDAPGGLNQTRDLAEKVRPHWQVLHAEVQTALHFSLQPE
jgi:hypothetical protein